MTETLAVSEEVAKSVERTRWIVLIWLAGCAIATRVLTPPALTERGAMLGLVLALGAAVLAIAARGAARSPKAAARSRLRAWLLAYAASALLGVIGLGIFFLRGDADQALGCAIGGMIFAASGARVAPRRPDPGVPR